MKTINKWFFVIILFSIQFVVYSQNFIDETKQWAIISTYSTKYENPYWTTYYKYSGDSVINGFSYHKLYQSTDSNHLNWTLFYETLWWERNDSVFIRGQSCGGLSLNDTTSLMYDFNIEEGDTFCNMKVDSIRYLEWGGSIRKFWFLGGFITWIERVGKFGNFNFSTVCYNSLAESLLCFQENGNLVYQNPDFTSCYVYTAVPSVSKNDELINLSPNPATNQITLTFSENTTNATYTLYDMQGKIQLKGKISKTKEEFNVATLPRGLYLLKIVTDIQIVTKKVILQ